MVSCVYFQLIVTQSNDIFDIRVSKVRLRFQERIYFPLRVVLGEVLVAGARRYDFDFAEDRYTWGHKLLGAELYPTFAGIGDNVSLPILHTQFQHFFRHRIKHL